MFRQTGNRKFICVLGQNFHSKIAPICSRLQLGQHEEPYLVSSKGFFRQHIESLEAEGIRKSNEIYSSMISCHFPENVNIKLSAFYTVTCHFGMFSLEIG